MRYRRWGRVLAAWILLLLFSPAAAKAQFLIENSRLLLAGRPFVVRGVVYSNVPIGSVWAESLEASECLYVRDFPLLAGLGANTVRTLALVQPGSRAFSQALAANDLYWLAGFPLDRFFDPQGSLSPETGQGSALRSQILAEFREYVEAWMNEPRLLAFVFGNEVDADYDSKFGGSPADFISLVHEAAAIVDESAEGRLITTSVANPVRIGALDLGTNDPNQPGLSFWSLAVTGQEVLSAAIQQARIRTTKPVLVSSFGVDAYDALTQSEAAEDQARSAGALGRELTLAAGNGSFQVLGGVWGALLDEWWRGGRDPARHGTEAVGAGSAQYHPSWLGLFGVSRSAVAGLDNLRPREAYFALAREWGGTPPAGLAGEGPPAVGPDGLRNAASGFAVIAPGSLFTIRGENFAPGAEAGSGLDLPHQLGGVSVCIDRRPAPLYFATADELRGQLPWETALGNRQALVYRSGVASQPVSAEVLAHAPGIFEGAVLRPGLPCPVNESNGVRPGDYLEIYGTGLGVVAGSVATGLAASGPDGVSNRPRALLGSHDVEVVFSGLLPGAAGVYQTNVRIPLSLPGGVAQLRLSQGAAVSNALAVQIVSASDSPRLVIDAAQPEALLVQAGGPPQRAWVRVHARNGFCDLVRFDVAGLAAGVRASIPVGFPGQTVPLDIWAYPAAPRSEDVPITLTALSSLDDTPSQTLRVTVLPALGDIPFRVVSAGWLSGAPVASFEVDGRLIYRVSGGGPGRGFNFLTVDDQTGGFGAVRNFDTWGSEEAVVAMETYLQSLPEGHVVFGAVADDGSLLLNAQTRRILRERLGAQLIDSLSYQSSWVIMSRVGAQRPIAEELSTDRTVTLERTLTFPMP